MDDPATLLTAIMFVTILGMGIGNLLMACADIAGGLRKPAPERIQLGWIILLLVAMLDLFWATTAILEVEDWRFLDFLYVITGPMLLFFAVSVITAPSDGAEDNDHAHYFSLCGRFFVMLALQEAWLLGIDLRYDSLTLISTFNAALLALFAVLAISRSYRLHLGGAYLAWLGLLFPIALRGLGVAA